MNDGRRSSGAVEACTYQTSFEGQRQPSERNDISKIHGHTSPLHSGSTRMIGRMIPVNSASSTHPSQSGEPSTFSQFAASAAAVIAPDVRTTTWPSFCPKHWLPGEPDLSAFRILTVPDDTRFSAGKKQAALAIKEFANDVVFRTKYNEGRSARMGQVPIITVAHLMGSSGFPKRRLGLGRYLSCPPLSARLLINSSDSCPRPL